MGYFASEPRTDDSARRIGEPLWRMFDRSNWKRLARARSHLETWLDEMPPHDRDELLKRLQERDDRNVYAAILELGVHALLVRLGRQDIVVSPPTPSGGRTDYLLRDLGVHLEVHRLSESQDTHSERQLRYQALRALNKLRTGRFSVTATLRAGTQSPAMKPVVRRAQEWLDLLDPAHERALFDSAPYAYVRHSGSWPAGDWLVSLEVFPLPAGAPEEEVIGTIIEPSRQPATVESIRNAVLSKRKQHRSLANPFVIVLDLSAGHATDRMIGDALYGALPLIGWDRQPEDALGPAVWDIGRAQGPTATANCSHSAKPPAAVLVVDDFMITDPHLAKWTLWIRPGDNSPLPEGPWRTARWIPGQNYGTDIAIDEATWSCIW